VRHVRMLGLCLGALFAVSAFVAGPAMAKKAVNEWEKFADCPAGYPPVRAGLGAVQACITGEAGPESFFQAGKVTVTFVKPIKLNGGFEENEETGELQWIGARFGDTISKEAEPGPALNEAINPELLPEAERARYEAYIAAGRSTKTTATIELAKPAKDIYLNEANLIGEEGEAFGFPVMIHLSNKFLGKKCYVGSTVEPIEVPFTTGATAPEPPNTPIHGTLGSISVKGEGTILTLNGTVLVNNEYAAPGVQGCGVNGGANAAIDAGLGLPSPAGSNTTQLVGNLNQDGSALDEEHWKFYP
jgi:hypothetical protein